MSFDKYIGKEHRKPYIGCKAIDPSCRNNGTCTYCYSNRTYNTNKRKMAADQSFKDYLDEEINKIGHAYLEIQCPEIKIVK